MGHFSEPKEPEYEPLQCVCGFKCVLVNAMDEHKKKCPLALTEQQELFSNDNGK